MKIAVVAANGRSGRAFVEQALAAGHSIRAGVHSGSLASHPNLTVVECDATVPSDVENLIKDQDAVVSFIGHVKGSPARVQTEAMKVLSAAMNKQGIKRLVSLTGTGVRFSGDRVGFVDWFLNTGIAIVDPERIQDGKDHVAFLQKSDLDWTILRVLKLQNVKPAAFNLTIHGPTKWFIGREEVAQAALQVLQENTFIKEAPIIGRATA